MCPQTEPIQFRPTQPDQTDPTTHRNKEMDAEQNRNQRRDKKIQHKKTGMRVSLSGLKLAEVLLNKLRKK